jgi:hypothetical protein
MSYKFGVKIGLRAFIVFFVLLFAGCVTSQVRRGAEKLPLEYYQIKGRPAITRAEMAAILVNELRVARWVASAPKPCIITDIGYHWAKDEIKFVVDTGIMEAYSNHTFLPSELLTRADCAQVVANIIKASGRQVLKKGARSRPQKASDVSSLHNAFDAIMLVTARKIMKGYEDGTFKPDGKVSGREAYTIIRRLGRFLS